MYRGPQKIGKAPKKMIHIATCFWNAAPYLNGCIDSVRMQSNREFVMHLMDDLSDDGGEEICRRITKGDERFKIISDKRKRYKLKNMDDLMSSKEIGDEDIIVELDGDDRLSHPDVLKKVSETYEKNPHLLIFNSRYVMSNGRLGWSEHTEVRTARYSPFTFSHLRTWKASLWRSVDKRYFVDPSTGDYFRITADAAYGIPMMELAGQQRYLHSEEVMVIYNSENPRNDDKPDSAAGGKREQIMAEMRIRLLDFSNNPYFDAQKIHNFIDANPRFKV